MTQSVRCPNDLTGGMPDGGAGCGTEELCRSGLSPPDGIPYRQQAAAHQVHGQRLNAYPETLPCAWGAARRCSAGAPGGRATQGFGIKGMNEQAKMSQAYN
jgi:hypothetical protein